MTTPEAAQMQVDGVFGKRSIIPQMIQAKPIDFTQPREIQSAPQFLMTDAQYLYGASALLDVDIRPFRLLTPEQLKIVNSTLDQFQLAAHQRNFVFDSAIMLSTMAQIDQIDDANLGAQDRRDAYNAFINFFSPNRNPNVAHDFYDYYDFMLNRLLESGSGLYQRQALLKVLKAVIPNLSQLPSAYEEGGKEVKLGDEKKFIKAILNNAKISMNGKAATITTTSTASPSLPQPVIRITLDPEPSLAKETANVAQLTALYTKVADPSLVIGEDNLNLVKTINYPRRRINPGNITSLELAEPFFVDVVVDQKQVVGSNPKSIPWTSFINTKYEKQFVKIEDETGGDSGLLALAGISAKTPQEQALLYVVLADNILLFHEQQAPKNFLQKWWGMQNNKITSINNPMITSSRDIFLAFDRKDNNPNGELRQPPEMQLLTYNPDGYVNLTELQPEWNRRIAELRQVVRSGNWQPHHHRWIQFLSNSVTVNRLIDLIQK